MDLSHWMGYRRIQVLLTKPVHHNCWGCAPQQEKHTLQWEAHIPQQTAASLTAANVHTQQWRPSIAKTSNKWMNRSKKWYIFYFSRNISNGNDRNYFKKEEILIHTWQKKIHWTFFFWPEVILSSFNSILNNDEGSGFKEMKPRGETSILRTIIPHTSNLRCGYNQWCCCC